MYRPSSKTLRAIATVGFLLLTTVAACNSPAAPDLPTDLTDSIPLAAASTLVFENASALGPHRVPIEDGIREAVLVVSGVLPVDRVTIIVRPGSANVIPEIGFGGRADGGTVWMTFDPNSPILAGSLDSELFPLLAHELHHVARIRAVGYGDHLLGAMVSEGLADQFAVEVAGIAPPLWSSALRGQQLEEWAARAQEQWFDTGYDHNAWFFGTGGAIPRWAGYSIGFAMIGDFLTRNPSRAASGLFAEPASSFTAPPQTP